MRIVLWPAMYLPNIGGLEIMTHALAKSLIQAGHEVLVFTCSAEGFLKYAIDGIEVRAFPFLQELFQARLATIKQILQAIDQELDQFQPDLIQVHGWLESFCFYQTRVIRKRKIPLCLTIHGLLEQVHYTTGACRELWSMAAAVNTVSEALQETLREQNLVHPFLQTIYNGLPLPSEPLQPLPSQKLLLIGRLTSEKGYEVAFQAVYRLLPKYPALKLRLLGDGPLFADLLQLRKDLELEEVIQMDGFVAPQEVPRFIDEASLVLVPSTYESFSLTALQAAQRARPVIASGVYGLKEVVEAGQTGLLIKPRSVEALAKAIDELLQDRDRLEKMGKQAYERAKTLFSIESTTQKYIQLYEKALKPLVSVIIPAYNGEAYIAQAIQSVLDQQEARLEIWVIDNGSTDQTEAIVRTFPEVQYRFIPQADTAVARNEGIRLAKGKYIAFLDQDDVWVPHKIAQQVQFLEEHPGYGAVIGWQQMFLEAGHEKPHWLKQAFLEKPQEGYLPSALMIRKETLEQTKSFDETLPLASDVAWFFTAQHRGIRMGRMETVVVYRRIHASNASSQITELQTQILGAIRGSLKERRHAQSSECHSSRL